MTPVPRPRDNTSAADVIRLAVQSGVILDWARIITYDDDSARLRVARRVGDGAPLRVYPKNIRAAIARAPRIGALTAADAERVALGKYGSEIADALVQVAAVGQLAYPIEEETDA